MQPSNQKTGVEPFTLASSQRVVLQIEDNEANANLVKQLIERRSDLALLTASTGLQGIAMALAHLPNVILLDINLPDISGYEALAALRANPLTYRIPVIALSSNAYKNQIQGGLEAGFFRYVTKPFKLDELVKTIDLALDTAAEATPSA
jgi:CheY-like chemotaxis protein